MEVPIFTVDAFTKEPFKGNPAAVCLLENELPEDLYQSIAAEMNLSETAFITKRNAKDFSEGSRFGLRWFTPTSEISLCGHATLASSAVIFNLKKNINPVVVFETLSGELYVRQHEDSIVMDFPLNKPQPQDSHEINDLLKAVVGDLPIEDVCYSQTLKQLMIRLSDTCNRSDLTSLSPVATELLKSEATGKIKGVIVTIKGVPSSNPGYDFYSRLFAPWFGVPEDPVCGSAHTVLAGYWSEKLNKKKMLAYQCSSRGGELELELRDDGRINITVDAFTNLPFKGNPAAVCLLENELKDNLYQSIAAEMNYSNTAFLLKRNSVDFSSGSRFGLRWFTPKSEVGLCGHATLGSAAVLFYLKKNINPVVVFETMSGELYVRQHEDSIVMDFPLNKPQPQNPNEIKDLLKAVVGDLPIEDVCYCQTLKQLMIRLSDTCNRSELTSLSPVALDLLKSEPSGKIKSVIVTLKGSPTLQPGYDFYSRLFAPWFGVPEDPVCAYQCSNRGGELELELKADGRLNISVDAFTKEPFKGNPAAVCLLENELPEDLYQSIAAEMNLSETAFITKRNAKDFSEGSSFGLRWFTPQKEVALCGHATLASAAVLFYLKKNINPFVEFHTMSGELYVRQHEDSIIMDFPLNKPQPQAVVGNLPIEDVCYSQTTKKLMIRLTDTCQRSELSSLRPEADSLLTTESTGRIKSVIVTLKGNTGCGYDFYSRNFAPWVGIPEDPVTAYQCSSRGGELKLEIRADGRLDITGQARVLLQGTLKI
ncbi:hypothetical protein DNTS_002662 [Danionella cerebrum]|uniref:Phenazine biosynthesis-like domain-containing protein n=1 Tax=Danionella cerebrum TaxID=2873325 RepID=A0A553QKS6_9TELE|nr:hypothetical protein DNTS_002662 [Danionella translucida]